MICPICDEHLGNSATAADLIAHTQQEHVLSDAQTQFGGRCEDYPCCGHVNPDGSSDCPVHSGESGYLPYPCLRCGKRIRSGSSDDDGSSYCATCIHDPATFHDDENCPGCGYCDRENDDDCDDDNDDDYQLAQED